MLLTLLLSQNLSKALSQYSTSETGGFVCPNQAAVNSGFCKTSYPLCSGASQNFCGNSSIYGVNNSIYNGLFINVCSIASGVNTAGNRKFTETTMLPCYGTYECAWDKDKNSCYVTTNFVQNWGYAGYVNYNCTPNS